MSFLTIQQIKADLELEFKHIAEELMLSFKLRTPKNEYHLAELEFYLNDGKIHKDESTHGDKRQKQSATWYFHRYSNGEYKKPNRQGLDITIGQRDRYYGGILIRALQNVADENDYIHGPSLIVDRILEDTRRSQKEIENEGVFENKLLRLVVGKKSDQQIFEGPRYNLGKNTPEFYLNKAYRFITYPKKKHMGKETGFFPYLKRKYNGDIEILKAFGRKSW